MRDGLPQRSGSIDVGRITSAEWQYEVWTDYVSGVAVLMMDGLPQQSGSVYDGRITLAERQYL